MQLATRAHVLRWMRALTLRTFGLFLAAVVASIVFVIIARELRAPALDHLDKRIELAVHKLDSTPADLIAAAATFVGSNYVYPYESNRVMGDFVSQGKGKVLDEIYVPLHPQDKDFDKVISRIKKTSPDVIFSTVVGSGTSTLYRAYRAAGFDPTRMPIASLTTNEAEVAEMGAEAAEGHITAAPFFETLSSPAARRFVTSFKEKYGPDAPVTASAEASYFQLHLAMRAVAKCGSDDPEQVLINLRDAEFDAGSVESSPASDVFERLRASIRK